MKIICVGKLKEQYLIDAVKEYQKRLTKYDDIKIIEVKDINYADVKKSLQEESKQIISHISKNDYVIAMAIDAKEYTSIELAEKINKLKTKNITFIIGGSNGLDEEVLNLSHEKISFSKLTFPHQLFRVILLEQIYRIEKIISNESYHK